MPHSTQSRLFQRQSPQPITWLILTNKTVQDNKLCKLNTIQNKQTTQKTAQQNYPGSIASYNNTRTRNEMGLFYNTPVLRQGSGNREMATLCSVVVDPFTLSAKLSRSNVSTGNRHQLSANQTETVASCYWTVGTLSTWVLSSMSDDDDDDDSRSCVCPL